MGKFIKSLAKIASELYSHSMSDRYSDAEEHVPTVTSKKPSSVDLTSFRANWDKVQKGERLDGRPKFFTTPTKAYFSGPQANPNMPAAMTPKQFNYKSFSANTPFSKIAPFIASEEAFDGNQWYTQSQHTGKDGGRAYGYFQIYEHHFVPGAKWYDPKWDKNFESAAKIYNIDPKKYGGKDGDFIDSTTGDGRKHLLSLSYPEFNNIDSDSLSYNIAKDIYDNSGIGAWNLKEDIIKSYNQGTPRHLRK